MTQTQKINYKNRISLYPLMKTKNIFFSIYKAFKDKNDHYKILYKSKNLILYPRSTLSLLRIYQYLSIFKSKRTIFIPDFICNESLSLLRRTNAKIIFYEHDLLKSKKLISILKSNKVDIFLFVNYFGKINRINSDLLEYINRKNITLIEDSTHCLTAFEKSFSDIEIYSPHKLFGIEDGSIIKFKDSFDYKQFKNFDIALKSNYQDFKLRRIIDFLNLFFKRKIRKYFGYKYPKLNFNNHNSSNYKINYSLGVMSKRLFNLYYEKIDFIKKKRVSNFNSWKKNLKLILPFLKMENLEYIPYLGIVNFENTKERTKILKQYNLYGLPFGNWPDLPPEVVQSRDKYKNAKRRFKNQITLPVHQDINSKIIENCIERCFEEYINSFKIVYSSTKKEIKILENGKIIGKFLIFYDSKNNQNILNLKFYKKFKDTYCDSRKFFYKLGRGIIKRLLIKKQFNFPQNFVLKLY
ncbi:hypothetical protein [uncultured Prochlorococcus sp.]|uniref:hypothetical protein n=1 Tax=uncultured Prochlorococcus sp. TaxID=159733 RepID=UPI00258CF799|nr:hypothetical protein [uncultured Prochlorococcus sp.]